MCLAAFALNAHPRFPLVIAANRDEFFARAAEPMHWWPGDGPALLAGRDLGAGGTWFGLSRAGRLALLTNVREPGRQRPDAPSRGARVVDWRRSRQAAPPFAAALAPGYNGFNLVTADLRQGHWHCLSNRAAAPVALPDGLHALSNAALGTPWPKTGALQAALADALRQAGSAMQLADALFAALADATPVSGSSASGAGVGLLRERQLSPRFVRIIDPARPGLAHYGTRCSTVLVREADGTTQVIERSVTADGQYRPAVQHRLARWPA